MADVKSQIAIKPRTNNIPPVLQRLQQLQREASEDSQPQGAVTGSLGSDVQNQTKSATADKGYKFGGSTNNFPAGTETAVAKSINNYTGGTGKVPALRNNITKEQKTADRKPKTEQTFAPTNFNKPTTNQSTDKQLTKQSSYSNVVDKVYQNFSKSNESKTLNQLSHRTGNAAVSPTASSSSTTAPKIPSPASNDDGVVINFRSALRTTRNSVLSEIFEKTLNSGSEPTSAQAGSTNNVVASSPSSSALSGASKSQFKDTSWTESGVSGQTGGQSSNNKLQNSNSKNITRTGEGDVVCRNSDQKRFKKISLQVLTTNLPAPRKSELPKNVDLTEIRHKYRSLTGNSHTSLQTRTADIVPQEPLNQNRTERVSLIRDISAEEEDELEYHDGYSLSPGLATGREELYADGETEKQTEGGNSDVIYEEAVLLTGTLEAKARKQQKEQAEIRKREEKERKEKLKEEKKKAKDEKMKIKREKELIQQQKHFHLTGNEVMVGDGVMKQDFKDMSLKQGQKVTIVRLDQNPPNMWLIKTDTGLGYVSSSLIEVDPAVIRQAMNKFRISLDEEDEDSIYDSVDVQ